MNRSSYLPRIRRSRQEDFLIHLAFDLTFFRKEAFTVYESDLADAQLY